jgi:type IV pilus assembly protein PilO
MDKNKIELIALILIITLGINYGAYSLYLIPHYQKVKEAKVKYETAIARLADLRKKSNQAKQLKADNEKLKEAVAKLEEMAPKDIDTPSLIYEFYRAVSRFGITGEDVSFQLNTEKSSTVSQNSNAGAGNSANNAGTTNLEPQLLTLGITLRVSGESSRIEEFLKNIDTITSRRLNVKSVTLSVKEISTVIKGKPEAKVQNLVAVIVFNQYILVDGSGKGSNRDYEFFDEKIGFDKIFDIFGNYNQAKK